MIDLAKGNPDAYPAEFIRDVAKSSVDDPLNARYTPFDGKPAFLQAAANWYRNVHGVELDWRSQLFAVEGAVDGLAGLFAILIDRGDAVAFADPTIRRTIACPSCTGRRRYCCPPAPNSAGYPTWTRWTNRCGAGCAC